MGCQHQGDVYIIYGSKLIPFPETVCCSGFDPAPCVCSLPVWGVFIEVWYTFGKLVWNQRVLYVQAFFPRFPEMFSESYLGIRVSAQHRPRWPAEGADMWSVGVPKIFLRR
jgi:hypothetical protein